jgi:acyl-coenzyme A synthetase/AMP-(fatty) acid ligase
MSLAGVSDVAVFGIPNEKQGNSLHINIVLSQQGIDIDTLSSAVSAKVIGEFGEFANPNQINVLEKLPLVESKHICRKLLKSQKVAMSYAA